MHKALGKIIARIVGAALLTVGVLCGVLVIWLCVALMTGPGALTGMLLFSGCLLLAVAVIGVAGGGNALFDPKVRREHEALIVHLISRLGG